MAGVKATWRKVVAAESEALRRSSHVCSVVGSRAYIFGGELRPREPRDNDVHVVEIGDVDDDDDGDDDGGEGEGELNPTSILFFFRGVMYGPRVFQPTWAGKRGLTIFSPNKKLLQTRLETKQPSRRLLPRRIPRLRAWDRLPPLSEARCICFLGGVGPR